MSSSPQLVPAPAGSTPPTAAPETDRRKILVIDDERYLRDFMRLALERAGYAVSVAANGREGLLAYATHRPDCVITDLLMPDKEGLETIIELRRHDHRTRIVAMSGGADPHSAVYLKSARHLGADATLEKPFTVAELLKTVALPAAAGC